MKEGEKTLPDYLIDRLKKKLIEKGSSGVHLDVRWRVLNGKKSYVDEIRAQLAKAVSVFHVSFVSLSSLVLSFKSF